MLGLRYASSQPTDAVNFFPFKNIFLVMQEVFCVWRILESKCLYLNPNVLRQFCQLLQKAPFIANVHAYVFLMSR